ncbi:MAG: tyrosine--tRNA ligase, partial [Planctomycetota bacterium]|nr:tyrosine--tRNA ligase [Planctomycetota bacterium]
MTQHTHTAPHGPGNFYHALKERDLVAQVTHAGELIDHLADPATPRRAYVGFDPTADSLTIGNLVGIMNLARFQRAGHIPFALMGGGTGLIGDPSGKSAERTLQTRDTVAHNVERIKRIFTNVIDFSPNLSNRAVMVNNLDWLGTISYLDMLRDVGKHFSVNMMIQKDSVRERLTNR